MKISLSTSNLTRVLELVVVYQKITWLLSKQIDSYRLIAFSNQEFISYFDVFLIRTSHISIKIISLIVLVNPKQHQDPFCTLLITEKTISSAKKFKKLDLNLIFL